MNSAMRAVGWAAMALSVVWMPACARADDRQTCVDGAQIAPADRIAACTTVIRSGRESKDNLAVAFTNRASGYLQRGLYDLAIEDCNEALKLMPDYALALINRADGYRLQGKYDLAIVDFDSALKLAPDAARAYVHRGTCYAKKGQYARAIQDYDQAIKLEPGALPAYNNRGNAYLAKGEYDRAFQDYDRGLALNPGNTALLNSRCWVRAVMGRELEKALADCNKGLDQAPRTAIFRDSRCLVYYRLDRFAEAIADCNEALASNPALAGSMLVRGLSKLKKGNGDGGKKDIAAAKTLDPNVQSEYAKYGLTLAEDKPL